MRETVIQNGRIRGIPCGWPSITVFYGIPYAKPPVGENRWRAPLPLEERWDGVRDCARAGAKCPQLGVGPGSFYEKEFYPYAEPQSEDCLYLNVWTPAQEESENLPVLFWVHGGAFMTGYGHSAHFDGEHFARQGIIVVTVNYRLNIFGWLTHSDLDRESEHGVSGNFGLLDQIAALRWVRENIGAFGGDPEKITIAGQSAGAASIQALLTSPLTKGMYRGAILQSGGGPIPFMDLAFPALRETEALCDLTQLGVSSIKEARALSADELSKRWINLFLQEAKEGRRPALNDRNPVVDGYVLPVSPEEAIFTGKTEDIPVLIGYTDREGLPLARDRQDLERIIRRDFGEKGNFYLDLCPLDGPDFKAYQDKMTTETAQSAAELYAETRQEQGKGDTYVYVLNRKLPGDDMGPFHAADLWYVFRTLMRAWRPWEAEDYMLAYACNTYWANFIKNGTPNGDRQPALPEWTPYTKEKPETLSLDRVIKMHERKRNARIVQRKRDLYGLYR
ncbi:MAG: carboxylesterase family protein [Lachnospiraceae bacterium]|nr:carboxylesterase family protein [Lachnospiraceae bacterium]